MIPVRVQPLAIAEAEEAAFWYEQRRPGLGMEFVLDLDAAIERAGEFPTTHAPLHRDARRVLLRRFPYAVYFVYKNQKVEVFAVLHQRRASWRWQSRL